tara:strand:+ start:188 stop:421 length:234 start_codon:yes stop_codon:yes gene_type:complete
MLRHTFGEIGLPVPTVKRSVVARLAAEIKQEIVSDYVAASESVVEVNACTRTVEKYIAFNRRQRSDGLEKRRTLQRF